MDCEKCYEEVVAKKREPSESYCFHDIGERFGLEVVASFDDPQASYSFDEFVIWQRKKDGALFYGEDSGCSCPSPFENVKSIADLTPITEGDSFKSFERDFAAYCAHAVYEGSYRYVEAHIESETVTKVRDLLRRQPRKKAGRR
jgi:hypothetical protein